jgi:hypothetical protein
MFATLAQIIEAEPGLNNEIKYDAEQMKISPEISGLFMRFRTSDYCQPAVHMGALA